MYYKPASTKNIFIVINVVVMCIGKLKYIAQYTNRNRNRA